MISLNIWWSYQSTKTPSAGSIIYLTALICSKYWNHKIYAPGGVITITVASTTSLNISADVIQNCIKYYYFLKDILKSNFGMHIIGNIFYTK